jgi:hypothetical protein
LRATNAGGHLEVFAQGTDGAVWHRRITSDPQAVRNADGRLEGSP